VFDLHLPEQQAPSEEHVVPLPMQLTTGLEVVGAAAGLDVIGAATGLGVVGAASGLDVPSSAGVLRHPKTEGHRPDWFGHAVSKVLEARTLYFGGR
jgi:hypothetical protein